MRSSRKMEHINHALWYRPSGGNGLMDIHPVPQSLPETRLDSVSLATRIGELNLSSPIVINAMTGGAAETEQINRELAEAAAACGLAMAVGSQMAALKDPSVAASYKVVRKVHPSGVIFANLGTEATVEQAKAAVDMLEANALQIHLNVMQELVMPEGDRDFTGASRRIEAMIRGVDVPVIVKEVGFGITGESAQRLRELGVQQIDIGGRGGTDFSAIENARRETPYEWLEGWGCTTSISLLEVLQYFPQDHIMASGGISNSMDLTKSLLLGASAVGMAGVLLRIQQEAGTEGLVSYVLQLEAGLRILMTSLGAHSIPELWKVPVVIGGDTGLWCKERGINTHTFARRSK
ncbi:MAG: type 2 isopentenyl-diphosphate Delta-isomerase [Gorillibacterium sp.]|nr:type 2 isopentenyl-diphosphate Delta-isomerase [Gorillibacterium sp.]